ncbi:alanine acetyltransferase [Pseudoroseomonas rhizosphaerae]|uniref:Alanine acetyltransferase n=1 Tax=Teichococcus rhizosphaerae TaxID=1335062 RepID=A0A2C7A341_9PROT|nr:GFA family protein [Pseudoroseomonas rhizosphaerae]PHK94488.1 alanine acetyltransferase [Pseudoroseomonas rhizosphaerae]
MPITLEGSCRCGTICFSVASHTPHPYQRCYCSICRKTAGGGGYAINIMGVAETLKRQGRTAIYRAEIRADDGRCETSSGERHFCPRCASALWMADPSWPGLVHPFASAIDTPLPVPPSRVHLMLKDKAPWVEPQIGQGDACFDAYPEESIEEWHRRRGLWVA